MSLLFDHLLHFNCKFVISKTGLEKSEDFSRPVLFLETYVTASWSFIILKPGYAELLAGVSLYGNYANLRR